MILPLDISLLIYETVAFKRVWDIDLYKMRIGDGFTNYLNKLLVIYSFTN